MDYQSTIKIFQHWYQVLKYEIKKPFAQFELNFDFIDLLVVYTLLLWLVLKIYQKFLKKGPNVQGGFFKRTYASLFGLALKLPPVAKYVDNQMSKIMTQFEQDINKFATKKTFKIPDNGMTTEKVQERLQEWLTRDNAITENGKLSGSLYITPDKKFENGIVEFSKNFMYHNPMHFDSWPAARQMEAEVIRMTADLFGQEKEGIGIFSSGGTESILLSVLAYRNWARETKGINKPNLVLPDTAHVAFNKACSFFCVETRMAKIDERTHQVSLSDMKSLIDENTIALVASAPGFPAGVIDPVEEIAAIAKRKKIGCHVDACLGGFIIAFQKDKLPRFDFSVDGVTSISCDHHKYGLAPKGASVVLFKTKELRRHSFYAYSTWPGGMYSTPTISGSRTAVGISGAWYAMVTLGRKRFTDMANNIMETTQNMAKALNKIPGIRVIGDPKVCVVGFTSTDKKLNVFSLHQILIHKGWNIPTLQKPNGIHITITNQNANQWKQLVRDVSEAVDEVRKNPGKYKGGSAGAIYGTSQSIPDKGFVDLTIKLVIDQVLKA